KSWRIILANEKIDEYFWRINFRFCKRCEFEDTYSLPSGKDGVLKLHSEKKCPLDDFDLVYWQGSGGCFCSFGVLESEFFENVDNLRTQGLVQCPRKCASGHGVLVLDPQSAPKWRFACNRCSSVLIAFEGAQKLKVLERQCEACLAQWVQVDYKDDKCPLPDGESQFKGCIFCDESVQSLINMNHLFYERADSNMIGQQQGGGRRGGSRGGGRG
ncbi:unnamed protein product, partial [Anisakis simplex]|uniref:DNA topoisomerase n=1 Tax=Anisakis simplex TaxID=6269 RepID=A0A0M3KHG6_ANISI